MNKLDEKGLNRVVRPSAFCFYITRRSSHPGTAGGAFEDGGRVLAAHDAQNVQEVRHRARFAMPRLPKVENVLRRARLRREIVDVPKN